MGCKSPLDARFEASESSRRALSDSGVANREEALFFYPFFTCSYVSHIRKNTKNHKRHERSQNSVLMKYLKSSGSEHQFSDLKNRKSWKKNMEFLFL